VNIIIYVDFGKRRGCFAQIERQFGAGVEKGWGPAPLERADVCFAAQVPGQKPHPRQKMASPAPKDPLFFRIFAFNSTHTMTDIESILSALRQFNQERDWDQFHNGKDLAIGLSIEAAELLECFLWKAPEEASIDKIREELADVLNFAFQIADKYGLDIKEITMDKIRRNAEKYPVEKAKGSAKKYDEL
jgi:NTP pyrophosphatase (non-canonical NTP hydrolase)